MSISLKALYDQVQNIETLSGIKSISLNQLGYIEFSNGLIINWGNTPNANNGKDITTKFAKAFTKTCYAITCGNYYGKPSAEWNAITIKSFNTTQFVTVHYDGYAAHWIAIGYLITNSIRSLLGGGLGWL